MSAEKTTSVPSGFMSLTGIPHFSKVQTYKSKFDAKECQMYIYTMNKFGKTYRITSFSPETRLQGGMVNHFQIQVDSKFNASVGNSWSKKAPMVNAKCTRVMEVTIPEDQKGLTCVLNAEVNGLGIAKSKVTSIIKQFNGDAATLRAALDGLVRTKTEIQNTSDSESDAKMRFSTLITQAASSTSHPLNKFVNAFKTDRVTKMGILATAWQRVMSQEISIQKLREHYGSLFSADELRNIAYFGREDGVTLSSEGADNDDIAEYHSGESSRRKVKSLPAHVRQRFVDEKTGVFSPLKFFIKYPYRLLDVLKYRTFPFIDENLAMAMYNLPQEYRVQQCALYFLRGIEGFCLPYAQFLTSLQGYFRLYMSNIPSSAVDGILRQFDGVVIDGPYIYAKTLYAIENELCFNINKFVQHKQDTDFFDAIKDSEAVSIDDDQTKALRMAVGTHSLCIINGMAGTGKTTVIKAICNAFGSRGVPLHLMAPTGKAATRMSEKTGLPASTIDRVLNDMLSQESTGALCGVVVIDEASMMPAMLFLELLRCITPQDTRIILIGDTAQLEPVGKGKVFNDIIDAGKIHTVTLNKVHRQGYGKLLDNAIYIRRYGETSSTVNEIPFNNLMIDDSFQIRNGFVTSRTSVVDYTMEVCGEPRYAETNNNNTADISFPQVIAGTRNLCAELNIALRDKCNGNRPPSDRVIFSLRTKSGSDAHVEWRIGDRVICTRNQYDEVKGKNKDKNKNKKHKAGPSSPSLQDSDEDEGQESVHKIVKQQQALRKALLVCNGEQGWIISLQPQDKTITAYFPTINRQHTFFSVKSDDTRDFELAYAITVHKSQGSEYKNVVCVLGDEVGSFYTNKLLYTAVTRASDNITLVASSRAINNSIKNKETTLHGNKPHSTAAVNLVKESTPQGSYGRKYFTQVRDKIRVSA